MSRTRALLGLLVTSVVGISVLVAQGASANGTKAATGVTATPIKHLVVIFQENVSFDHYFGTYPNAANTDGQPFAAAPETPAVAALKPATDASIPVALQHGSDLTATNPNTALPKRFDSSPTGLPGSPAGEITCDQDHNYSDEQQAFDGGAMDQFVQSVGTDGSTHTPGGGTTSGGALCDPKIVMDYYDGNTVTGFWNYAQHYAMSDNSFSPTFGPSSPGAINLVSGDTGHVDTAHEVNSPSVATSAKPNADLTADGTTGGFSLTSDAQPYWDDCSTRDAVALTGTNIGDELNAAGLSWGWFQGGFRPTTDFAAAATAAGHTGQPTSSFMPDEFKAKFAVSPASDQGICNAVTPVGVALGETAATHQFGFKDDYIPHHEPFQYYASTANPHHLPPSGLSAIGTDTQHSLGGAPQFDTANHQYDTSDFDQLVAAIASGQLPASALPAVTFLKAPGYEDGHGAYSDPADEQAFVTREVNALMQSPDWGSTAVIVNYDDSDGWYDHVYSGVTNPSLSPADNLTNTKTGPISAANPTSGQCGPSPQTSAPLGGQQGRCGFGPRQPLLVISSCAKQNYVDHNLSDLASIPNFIEYNWGLPPISGSFDQVLTNSSDKAAGIPFDLAGAFDFKHCSAPTLLLDPKTGQQDLTHADEQGQNLKGANLSGAEAANSNFQGSNLQNGFLQNANLEGATLQGVNLSGADLTKANLQRANIQGANMRGANLTGANLTDAVLQGVNLSGANLTNANLTGAKTQSANLNGITWSNSTCPDGTNSNAHGNTCIGRT